MRLLRCGSVLLSVILAGCHSAEAPASYNAGSWRSLPILPSGSYTQFSLDTVGGAVRGDGQDFGIAGRPLGTFTVTGLVSYPNIALAISYPGGERATYFAQFQSPSLLLGSWTATGQPPQDSISFGSQ